MRGRGIGAGAARGVSRRHFVQGVCGAFLLGGLTPARAIMQQAREMAWLDQVHQIGVALFSYTTDNNGNYPEGKSSTAIFQTLIDSRYVSDPAVFFVPIANKTQPAAGQPLKAENVCFDMTCCLDISSPDTLPLIYLTGYKIAFKANGSATPIVKPPPDGIVVMYKNNSAKIMRPTTADGVIPNFIPTDFPANKTYRQLTPDGVMPQ